MIILLKKKNIFERILSPNIIMKLRIMKKKVGFKLTFPEFLLNDSLCPLFCAMSEMVFSNIILISIEHYFKRCKCFTGKKFEGK